MLHTKIVDSKKEKILTSNAEKFIKDSKFGASIYFLGTVRNINDNKTVTGITYDSHDEMVFRWSIKSMGYLYTFPVAPPKYSGRRYLSLMAVRGTPMDNS